MSWSHAPVANRRGGCRGRAGGRSDLGDRLDRKAGQAVRSLHKRRLPVGDNPDSFWTSSCKEVNDRCCSIDYLHLVRFDPLADPLRP